MKFTLLPLLTALLCSSLTAQAVDHARAAYQDSSKINKFSRRAMLARAPNLTPVRWNYPVPSVLNPPAAMPEHAYSTESVYDQPGYRPASTYGSYVAIDSGGFGGRAFRRWTGYSPLFVDGWWGGGSVIINKSCGPSHGGGGHGGGGHHGGGGGMGGHRR